MTLNRPANTHADRPWLAYLQLLRLPNVFTAWADVSMGYLLATGGHASWRVFDLRFRPIDHLLEQSLSGRDGAQ